MRNPTPTYILTALLQIIIMTPVFCNLLVRKFPHHVCRLEFLFLFSKKNNLNKIIIHMLIFKNFVWSNTKKFLYMFESNTMDTQSTHHNYTNTASSTTKSTKRSSIGRLQDTRRWSNTSLHFSYLDRINKKKTVWAWRRILLDHDDSPSSHIFSAQKKSNRYQDRTCQLWRCWNE